jgi:acetyltransferase-like isoleucine patch superfamily enzyme
MIKAKLRGIVVKNPVLLYWAKKIQYRSLFGIVSKKIYGKRNKLSFSKGAMLFNASIQILGNDNTIIISDGCELDRISVFIRGNGNRIELSEKVRAHRHTSLWIEDDNNLIFVGEDSDLGDAHIAVTENGKSITVGSDCLFAKGIEIRTGDSHSIVDAKSGNRINYAENVVIGNHVWIGSCASVLKGAIIPNNSVVATRSVVTKTFIEENILLAGIPAKIVKQNINWLGERI